MSIRAHFWHIDTFIVAKLELISERWKEEKIT